MQNMVKPPCWCEPSSREGGRVSRARRRRRREGSSVGDGGQDLGRGRDIGIVRCGRGIYQSGRELCGREMMKREDVEGGAVGEQSPM